VTQPGVEKKFPTLEVWKDISMTSKTVVDENGWNTYSVAKSVNARAVRNSLHNIFTWIPGERVLLPEFGSNLRSLLYEGITPLTEERIIAEIRKCVTDWEPRANIVEIRNISDVDDTEDNTIHLDVVFTIPSLNNEQYIYSFIYDNPQ